MASSGPNSPGTLANDATVGTIAWTNPSNAAASDNVYATTGSLGTTHYLKATNFGFSIPVGATINGIIVGIERNKSGEPGATIQDSAVRIVKANASIGTTNKGDIGTNWPTTDTYKTYGSSSDLWGEIWTATDINDVDFGVVLSTLNTPIDSGVSANVDHIRITVYYSDVVSPFPSFRRVTQGGPQPS